MESYKFKSEIVLAILPFGVTTIAQVSREEALGYLAAVKEQTKRKFSDYGNLFMSHCVGEYPHWGIETISKKMEELRDDVWQLTQLLVVQKESE